MNLLNDNAAQVAAMIFVEKSRHCTAAGEKFRKESLERIAKEAFSDAKVFISVWEREEA